MAKGIKIIYDKSPGVLDTSPSPPKKANILCGGIMTYENIVNQLKGGNRKGCSYDWVCFNVGIKGKVMYIDIEEKAIIYAWVIHISTYQKINCLISKITAV